MATNSSKIRVKRAVNGKWYWSLVAENGEIVADGAQGYDSAANALRGFRTVVKLIVTAKR